MALIVLDGEPKALVIISKGIGKLPLSNLLESLFITFVFLSPSWLVVLSRKAALFCFLSIKKTCLSGQAIAIGIPGKPPPLPRSKTFLPKRVVTERESSMCSFMFVVWLLATRLWVLFQVNKSSSNFSSRFFWFLVTVNLSST